jgi:hypothetical protein
MEKEGCESLGSSFSDWCDDLRIQGDVSNTGVKVRK